MTSICSAHYEMFTTLNHYKKKHVVIHLNHLLQSRTKDLQKTNTEMYARHKPLRLIPGQKRCCSRRKKFAILVK